MTVFAEKVQIAFAWADMLDDPEPIWAPQFQQDYCGFEGTITCRELNILVDLLNLYWTMINSPRRVCWSAGELIPAMLKDGVASSQ